MAEKRTGNPILGTLVILGSVVVTYLAGGGHPRDMIMPTVFLHVTVGVLGAVLIGCGLKTPMIELWNLLRGQAGDFLVLRRALRLAVQAGALFGLITTLMGLIHVMGNLSEANSLGKGCALAVNGFFYGLLYALLGFALEALATRRAASSPETGPTPSGEAGRLFMGAAIILGVVLGGHVARGDELHGLMNLPSFFLVVGSVLGALLISTGVIVPMKQFGLLLSGGEMDKPATLAEAFRVMVFSAPVAGFVGATIGLIGVLSNLSDPSRLGASVAIAFLAMLYGVTIALLAHAGASLVESCENEDPKRQEVMYGPMVGVAGFGVAFGMFGLVLYATAA